MGCFFLEMISWLTNLARRLEVTSCQGLEARTPSLKFLFASIFLQGGSDFERMIKGILDVLMLCFQNTRRLSLFMDVSGIFMKGASTLKCQSPMSNNGRRNSTETGNVMHEIRQSLKRWDGLFLLSGSAN